ncbi:hypothetical protein [Streptomyces sp. NPDC058145]|uniref:hypothetical protein n=1 Tax=Streptomyces sp. NPDC058145 TaxID=3346356 RepID=UPI0036E01280
MQVRHSHFLLSRVVGLLAVPAVGLAMTACSPGASSAKREYAVPSSLCGTPVPASALEPLLPAGKKISSRKSGSPGYARCQVSVDGQLVLSSIIERWQPRTTLSNVAFGTYGLTAASIKMEAQRFIVSESAAVERVDCNPKRKDAAEVFTVIRKHHDSVDAAAMEKAIAEFADAASTSAECTEKDT